VTEYRLVAQPQTDVDIEATYHWYESERLGLGDRVLQVLRSTYNRIVQGPLKYQELRSGIRRALIRRFPYAVYFAVEVEMVIVLAVLHASREPAEWQRRRT
jgi:plasmid stabilization system protein ParE